MSRASLSTTVCLDRRTAAAAPYGEETHVVWNERGRDVKVAILAGGTGSRLAEETESRPKPMVEIGGHPILWHIMRHYAHFGFDEFVIALGYKGDYIKKYMVDYCSLSNDLTVSLRDGTYRSHDGVRESWTIDLI